MPYITATIGDKGEAETGQGEKGTEQVWDKEANRGDLVQPQFNWNTTS